MSADEGIEAEVDLLTPEHGRYTAVPNALARNHGLSTDARAILIEWLSHTAKWHLDLRQTAQENHLPYERARKAVKQLRDGGYVHFIKRSRGDAGFTYAYRVTDHPVMGCGIPGCQDCAKRTPPKTDVCDDQGEHPVSAGDPTPTIPTACETGVITEDHLSEPHTEPQEDQDLYDDEPKTGSSSTSGPASQQPDDARPALDEPGHRDDADRICKHLADRIEQRWGTSRRPSVGKKWRQAARLMIDNDHLTEAQVHAAIDWCQDHEFWAPNIMSLPKLREKYLTLRAQAARDQERAQRQNGYKPSTTDARVAQGRDVYLKYKAEEERAEMVANGTRQIEAGS